MRKIISALVSLAIIIWIAIIAYDYYLVTSEKVPKFCIKTGINEYSDGAVKWCNGLGYKVFNYKRETYNAVQFGPFWIKEQFKGNE